MPGSRGHDADKSGNSRSQGRSKGQGEKEKSRREGLPVAGEASLAELLVGGEIGQATFERHAALLGDSRMSHPANAGRRAAVVRQLQRSFGNHYVQRLIDHVSRLPGEQAQTKLAVGPADDKYEQEADEVARAITRSTPPIEEEEARLMRTAQEPIGAEGGEADAALEHDIQSARGGGQPLPDGVRGSLEAAFGADFSTVRVHTDSQADRLNESVSARAFTVGQDIFFRKGEYSPDSASGRETLAHELTHVVQQSGAAPLARATAPGGDGFQWGAVQRKLYKEGESGSTSVPQKAKDVAKAIVGGSIKTTTVAVGQQNLPGFIIGSDTYVGDRPYGNKSGDLPSSGAPYKEYDVNPYKPGVNRGTERIVIGSDKKKYYTDNHYTDFTEFS